MLEIIIYIVVLALVLLVTHELLRRYSIVSVILFTVLPLALIPFWLKGNIDNWFHWVKIYSVVSANIFFIAFRHTKLHDKKWPKYIIYAFLSVNILEACIQDFTMGQISHILNGIAGLLLIFTLNDINTIEPDSESKSKDLAWDIPFLWVVGYTIWNYTFVYSNFPAHAGNSVAVLGIPLAIAVWKNKYWLQARAITLGVYLIILFSFQNYLDTTYGTENWKTDNITLTFSIISVVFMAAYGVCYLKQFLEKKKA